MCETDVILLFMFIVIEHFMQVFTQMPRSWGTLFRKSTTRWAGGTMNEEFSTLHKVELSWVLKISSLLYRQQVRVFLNNHERTGSNPLKNVRAKIF